MGGATYAEALAASEARAAETGALEVHAYDQPEVLAGQGTVALEFEADAPGLTHVLVAAGGGGLIGGMAAWFAGGPRAAGQRGAGGLPRPARRAGAGAPVAAPVGGAGGGQPGRAAGGRR